MPRNTSPEKTNYEGINAIERSGSHHLNEGMKVNIITVGQVASHIPDRMLWEEQSPPVKMQGLNLTMRNQATYTKGWHSK